MNAREIPWGRWMPWIVVAIVVLLGLVLIPPAIQQARETARRSSSKNNLRQIGLAFQTYHEIYECLPSGGVFDSEGTAYHGWGTAFWPNLESSPYAGSIDYDSPWDSPQNSYLFKTYPHVFSSPQIPMKYTSEGFAPMHYIGNQNLLHRNSSVKYEQMENGLEHTWVLTDQFQDWWPWGSPYNWTSLEWPRPGSEGKYGWSGGVAMLLLADGSIETFGPETDSKIIQSFRDAPPIPAPKQIEKPPNKFRFDSAEWKQIAMAINGSNAEPKAYCVGFISPSGKIDTIYCFFEHPALSEEDELFDKDLQRILDKFPGAQTMTLPLLLDDQMVSLLSDNKELKTLQVGKIELTSQGIEHLKEFPKLEYLSGNLSDEILEEICKTVPGLKVKNKAYWR